jgi:K+-sensing histidine kinase KdpD
LNFSRFPASPDPPPAWRKPNSLAEAIENNRLAGIAFAVAVVGASALIRGTFLGELGTRNAFITFYPAVAIAALFGGLRAGVVAALLSAALADYFWIPPVNSFSMGQPVDQLSMAVFLISATIVSWTAEQLSRANRGMRRAEASRRAEVELLVHRRTAELVQAADALQTEITRRRSLENGPGW